MLLAESPMHGYQMITELTERSGGAWRPSAGSVHPTLQQLEDEGLVQQRSVTVGASTSSPMPAASSPHAPSR